MDRISINNLFPNNSSDFKPLDVYSLYNPVVNNTRNKNSFNVDKLTTLRKERKMKIFEHYEQIYKTCLNKIDVANDLNKTEITFEIPESIFGHYDYKKSNCLKYIELKLRKMYIDTFIYNDNAIYISWENIEKNKQLEQK